MASYNVQRFPVGLYAIGGISPAKSCRIRCYSGLSRERTMTIPSVFLNPRLLPKGEKRIAWVIERLKERDLYEIAERVVRGTHVTVAEVLSSSRAPLVYPVRLRLYQELIQIVGTPAALARVLAKHPSTIYTALKKAGREHVSESDEGTEQAQDGHLGPVRSGQDGDGP